MWFVIHQKNIKKSNWMCLICIFFFFRLSCALFFYWEWASLGYFNAHKNIFQQFEDENRVTICLIQKKWIINKLISLIILLYFNFMIHKLNFGTIYQSHLYILNSLCFSSISSSALKNRKKNNASDKIFFLKNQIKLDLNYYCFVWIFYAFCII